MRQSLACSLLLSLTLAACGKVKGQSAGGAADGGDAAGGSGGTGENTDAPADCAAIELLSPTVVVIDDADGSAICDPSFMLVTGPDGGASPEKVEASICSSNNPCPDEPQDASSACRFQLGLVAFPVESHRVQVSKAGFEPVDITVTTGGGGCIPLVPASHTTVRLHRSTDTSPDTTDAASGG